MVANKITGSLKSTLEGTCDSITEQFREERPESMSVSILDQNSRIHGLRTSFRKHTDGPERELVNWFLEQDAIRTPRGCRTTLFREPRLESGFPDLVAVTWHERTASEWSDARAELTSAEIRVLHYLAHHGPCTEEELSAIFVNRLSLRLDRLLDAETVRRTSSRWVARPLSKIFAVRRLVAIEAKLSQWADVLQQAHLNTWFATESYVLIPKLPRSESFSDSARSQGIGIWTKEHGEVFSASHHGNALPRSYASWLFNEWVWQAARKKWQAIDEH